MGSSRQTLSPSNDGHDSASWLGFHFRDPSLFGRALVHRSYCNEHGMDASESYERLEFLGDAVLELIVSDNLYDQFPNADEGQLTKSRSSLVRGQGLADVARRLELGDMLMVGHGVESSGGRDQDSVLAAALEAVIAAIYLDQGVDAARQFVNLHLAPELAYISQQGAPPENPKSRLQEFLQGQGYPTPSYRLADRRGPDHNPVFSVEAVLGDRVIGKGQGGKKQDAERAAAEAALDKLLSGGGPALFESGDTGQPSQVPVHKGASTPVDNTDVRRPGIFSRFKLPRKD